MLIRNLSDFVKSFDSAPYAWPGGYPVYYVTADGEALSYDAVVDNIEEVIFAIVNPEYGDDWNVVGLYINYEDHDLYCAHTHKPIESAYGSAEEGFKPINFEENIYF